MRVLQVQGADPGHVYNMAGYEKSKVDQQEREDANVA